jgi:hypothetical protein
MFFYERIFYFLLLLYAYFLNYFYLKNCYFWKKCSNLYFLNVVSIWLSKFAQNIEILHIWKLKFFWNLFPPENKSCIRQLTPSPANVKQPPNFEKLYTSLYINMYIQTHIQIVASWSPCSTAVYVQVCMWIYNNVQCAVVSKQQRTVRIYVLYGCMYYVCLCAWNWIKVWRRSSWLDPVYVCIYELGTTSEPLRCHGERPYL